MKMYSVWCSYGDWDDSGNYYCFVTDNEQLAKDWCEKFNSLLYKWKAILKPYSIKQYKNILDYNKNLPIFVIERFHQIIDINQAAYSEIEYRK